MRSWDARVQDFQNIFSPKEWSGEAHELEVVAAIDPQCILSSVRAIALLLLASCFVLRVSCVFLQGSSWLSGCSCWAPCFVGGLSCTQSGVKEYLEHLHPMQKGQRQQ